MKLTIMPDALSAALAVAQPSVKRSTLMVLEMVLLDAHVDGGLTITGTDMETRAWHTVSADVMEAGAVCLPPNRLVDFLSAVVGDEPITLTVDEQHKAELRSGTLRARIAGTDAEQFPVIDTDSAPAFDHTFGAVDLATTIGGALHAVLPKADREILTGVLAQIVDGKLTFAAADGHRLAIRTLDVADAPDLSVIVQGKAVAKAVKALDNATSVRVVVDSGKSALLLDSEAGCWSVRLIDGQFPDFNRIIPRDPPIAVTFSRDDMLRVLKLVGKIDDSTYIVRLNVGPEQIEVHAGSPTADQEADAVIGATLERGSGLVIAFNGRYLEQALRAINSVRVRLELVKADSPAILRPVDGTGVDVLMPMLAPR